MDLLNELIDGFKQKGLQDEEIKKALADLKVAIDGFLNQNPNEEAPAEEQQPAEETEEQKENRVFGI